MICNTLGRQIETYCLEIMQLRSRLQAFYFWNPAFELKTCKNEVCLVNLGQKQHALGSNSSVKCSPENQNEDVCF